MKNISLSTSQKQNASQIQTQKLSLQQIQSLNLLSLNINDLREEIYKTVNQNPALEIVKDSYKDDYKTKNHNFSETDSQTLLEQSADYEETLQEHLIKQINMQNLTQTEHELCISLIYNLDKNGFYGSMLDPSSFVIGDDSTKNANLVKKCLSLIQSLDPIGTCCKNAEESLYIQALHKKNPPKIALFLLEKPEHLELLNPPIKEIVYKKLTKKIDELHKQLFAFPLIIDEETITLEKVEQAIQFIQKLNPFPASNFGYAHSISNPNTANVVLKIEEINHSIAQDDEASGLIYGNDTVSFMIKYASGAIPEIRINPDYENFLSKKDNQNKNFVLQAKQFIKSLDFCKNTIALQGFAIAKFQREFLLKGPEFLVPLTRKQIATYCNIHESTVSRMTSKKNSKYIQTKWGTFPANYFFSSKIKTDNGTSLSSQKIALCIEEIIKNCSINNKKVSDLEITKILNKKGIKIARRTVTKYRNKNNINNSYNR